MRPRPGGDLCPLECAQGRASPAQTSRQPCRHVLQNDNRWRQTQPQVSTRRLGPRQRRRQRPPDAL
eukprot:9204575-Pyramimonas_sp.AAC.1